MDISQQSLIPQSQLIIPTRTKASPYAAYSIASSTHAPPLPHAPVLAVTRHVASGLLPKCEGGRPGSLLARNTEVVTAPVIRRSPRWSDAGKCQTVLVELILALLLLPLLSLVFESFGNRPSPSRFDCLESGAGGVQRHCGPTGQGNLVIEWIDVRKVKASWPGHGLCLRW